MQEVHGLIFVTKQPMVIRKCSQKSNSPSPTKTTDLKTYEEVFCSFYHFQDNLGEQFTHYKNSCANSFLPIPKDSIIFK